MASLPFIDTYVHFYALENPDLRYELLQPGTQHEIIEDVRAIKASWDGDRACPGIPSPRSLVTGGPATP